MLRSTAIPALTLALTLLSLPASAQDFDNVEIEVRKISETIFLLKGMGGNIAVCIGADGTFIVDDQFAPLTEKITQAIATFADQPVGFVINTHWHFDHTDGNENFGRAGAVIVAHANSRRRMESDQLIKLFDRAQAPYGPEGLPRITFDQSLRFHLNGETIDVFHPGPGHTDGDAVVFFREANVVHAGDVFVTYGLPFIDEPNGGSVNGLISALGRIDAMIDDETVIIPGHGDPSSREDLRTFRDMVVTIRDRILAAIEAGGSREDIVAGDSTQGFSGGGISPDDFEGLVYDSLVGERQ